MSYSYVASGVIGAIWNRSRHPHRDDAAPKTVSDRQHRSA